MNWVGSSGEGPPSLMEQASLPEFGWLATQVLHVESICEVESRVWPGLQHELLSTAGISLEMALKVRVTHSLPLGRSCCVHYCSLSTMTSFYSSVTMLSYGILAASVKQQYVDHDSACCWVNILCVSTL